MGRGDRRGGDRGDFAAAIFRAAWAVARLAAHASSDTAVPVAVGAAGARRNLLAARSAAGSLSGFATSYRQHCPLGLCLATDQCPDAGWLQRSVDCRLSGDRGPRGGATT